MAVQTFRAASFDGDLAVIDFRYDDTNNLVNQVSWEDFSDRPVRMVVFKQGATFADIIVPAHSGPQSVALSGNERFKVDTDAWTVSLSYAG